MNPYATWADQEARVDMILTVEGIYKDGKVEFAETPPGIAESRVYVTFLPDST